MTPIGRFIPLNPRDGAEVAFPVAREGHDVSCPYDCKNTGLSGRSQTGKNVKNRRLQPEDVEFGFEVGEVFIAGG